MNPQKHTLDYLKRLAKKVKKERLIPHSVALDIVAKENGFANWQHCQRSFTKTNIESILSKQIFLIDFTEWLQKNKNRNSPLGDLASDAFHDKNWPTYKTLDHYLEYLHSKGASWPAIESLKKAWKTYESYLRRKNQRSSNKSETKKSNEVSFQDVRKIVYLKNVRSIPFPKRSTEIFKLGDPAWISWNGTKAIPVTIIEVDDKHYTVKIERPRTNAGNRHCLFLDEVRSSPELACMNPVTL